MNNNANNTNNSNMNIMKDTIFYFIMNYVIYMYHYGINMYHYVYSLWNFIYTTIYNYYVNVLQWICHFELHTNTNQNIIYDDTDDNDYYDECLMENCEDNDIDDKKDENENDNINNGNYTLPNDYNPIFSPIKNRTKSYKLGNLTPEKLVF